MMAVAVLAALMTIAATLAVMPVVATLLLLVPVGFVVSESPSQAATPTNTKTRLDTMRDRFIRFSLQVGE